MHTYSTQENLQNLLPVAQSSQTKNTFANLLYHATHSKSKHKTTTICYHDDLQRCHCLPGQGASRLPATASQGRRGASRPPALPCPACLCPPAESRMHGTDRPSLWTELSIRTKPTMKKSKSVSILLIINCICFFFYLLPLSFFLLQHFFIFFILL